MIFHLIYRRGKLEINTAANDIDHMIFYFILTLSWKACSWYCSVACCVLIAILQFNYFAPHAHIDKSNDLVVSYSFTLRENAQLIMKKQRKYYLVLHNVCTHPDCISCEHFCLLVHQRKVQSYAFMEQGHLKLPRTTLHSEIHLFTYSFCILLCMECTWVAMKS